ncbi:hypothetical protein [Granulicella tundricola]|uniref:Uncharacterized protein n=1 Tax=Granulicella tundricola (strain ATCC BAA-1859 / DSM 23138 / MP5ACTX9) TaxID=1198114 RepID=E8X0E8_GRATM|nr:hypothetical protein [Granulicella tundricola]ADW67812.1 hypothetical protein AciX9_0742 [Granulicella tundricola MP5ACTX9]
MSNALPYLIPTFAVLLGVLFTRQDINALRAELKAELKSEIGQLRSEIITLRDNIHRDMIGLHERVATV